MADQFKNKRGTKANWDSHPDTVLAAGEFGIESDTFNGKVGNGVAAWNVLPYVLGPITAGKRRYERIFTFPGTLSVGISPLRAPVLAGKLLSMRAGVKGSNRPAGQNAIFQGYFNNTGTFDTGSDGTDDRLILTPGSGDLFAETAQEVVFPTNGLFTVGCEAIGSAGGSSAAPTVPNPSTAVSTTTTGSLTVPLPTGGTIPWQANDIQILGIWSGDKTATITPPTGSGNDAGWSLIFASDNSASGSDRTWWFWRRLTSSSTASVFTVPTGSRVGLQTVARGCKTSGVPFQVDTSSTPAIMVGVQQNNASDNTQPLPDSPTAAAANRTPIALLTGGISGLSRTWPTGWTGDGNTGRLDFAKASGSLASGSALAGGSVGLTGNSTGVAASLLLVPDDANQPGQDIVIVGEFEVA